MTSKTACKLLTALLDDDEGICEKGYDALILAISKEFNDVPNDVQEIFNRVDAANGRFYLKAEE